MANAAQQRRGGRRRLTRRRSTKRGCLGFTPPFGTACGRPGEPPRTSSPPLHAAVLESLADPSLRQRFATHVAKASGGTCSLIPIATALESTA
jgi:hypothetical protein